MTDRRVLTLTSALGFLQLPPTAPELQLLHRWWAGIGLIAAPVRAGTSPSRSMVTVIGADVEPALKSLRKLLVFSPPRCPGI